MRERDSVRVNRAAATAASMTTPPQISRAKYLAAIFALETLFGATFPGLRMQMRRFRTSPRGVFLNAVRMFVGLELTRWTESRAAWQDPPLNARRPRV